MLISNSLTDYFMKIVIDKEAVKIVYITPLHIASGASGHLRLARNYLNIMLMSMLIVMKQKLHYTWLLATAHH